MPLQSSRLGKKRSRTRPRCAEACTGTRARRYIVRTTPAGAQTSLGPRSPGNQAIYDRFMQRKQESAERMAGLKAALDQHRRLNRALRVGRVEPLVGACWRVWTFWHMCA